MIDVNKMITWFVGLHPKGSERLSFQFLYEKLPRFCVVCGLFIHGGLECGDGLHDDTVKQYDANMVTPWRTCTLKYHG
jgi:hypothetical protein